jgi:hypothetical protein
MAQLNLFEMRTRNAIAISILNKVRHWLLGRVNDQISREREIMRESLMLEIEREKKFSQAILYSMQSCKSRKEASALQISEALHAACDLISKDPHEKQKICKSFERAMNVTNTNNINEDDYKNSLNLVVKAIHIIGNSDSLKPTGLIASKVL